MNKISYIMTLFIFMSASFTAGVIYSDEVKSNVNWIFDDGSKYQEDNMIKIKNRR